MLTQRQTAQCILQDSHRIRVLQPGDTVRLPGVDRRLNRVDGTLVLIRGTRTTAEPVWLYATADAAMADLLEELWEAGGPFRFLLHSYTGGPDLARRGAALGGTFSVNGIASFKNATDVRDVIRDHMPDDRIIIFATRQAVPKIEKILAVKLGYF